MTKGKLLIIALACSPLPILAAIGPGSSSDSQNVTIDSLEWTLSDATSTATLTRYKKKGDTAIIPEKIEYDGKTYQVVAISNQYNGVFEGVRENIKKVVLPHTLQIVGNYSFYSCNNLQEINLPESVDSIGSYAFRNCNNLKSITIPSKVKVLGENSISHCDSLQAINLPEGLTTIMRSALSDNSSLPQLTLPSTLKYLGDYALYGNHSLQTMKCLSPVVPQIGNNVFNYSSLYLIYVPEGSGKAYRLADVWKNYVIAQGNGLAFDINLTTPGELGNEILKLTEDLADVNILKIKGVLNDDDIYNIRNRMPNLMEIDMSEVDMEELPDEMFSDREAISKITLPKNLAIIGNRAFTLCKRLESLTIPNSVISIGTNLFASCYSLREVKLSENIKTIPNSCFYNASSLETITLPEHVTTIEYNAFTYCHSLKTVNFNEELEQIEGSAFYSCEQLQQAHFGKNLKSIGEMSFYSCKNLSSVKFPDNLEFLGNGAFCYCPSLENVLIPGTVKSMVRAFSGCDNLNGITCLSIQPPLVSNDNPIGNTNMEAKTLYVPSIVLNRYKQTTGWDAFTQIKPIDYLPSQMEIYQDFTLDLPESMPNDYKPKVTISNWYENSAGHLTVKGNNTLSMSHFNTIYDNNQSWYYGGNTDTHKGTLVNEAKMQADSVSIDIYASKNRWEFISFPFDVKVSDIKCLTADTQWVIRKYDGEARANAETGNTWQTMKSDSILHANEGYILQCTNGGYWSDPVQFHVPAMDNANKNNIFASTNQAVFLKDYPSEFAHNSGWNLLGNPYPAFFDTRFFDYASPFIVWDKNDQTYEAYSPIDDSYILSPSEAFFVQKPAEQDAITFNAEGRQHNRVARTIENPDEDMDNNEETGAKPLANDVRTARAKALSNAKREVYNLTLSSFDASDRTRFVINPQAEMGYNAAHDAGKMFSHSTKTPQLYTIGENDGIDYAINERPLGNGLIRIGAIFAEPGTYTIALADEKTAVLIDKLEGKEVELDANGYTFTTKAGECRDRFCVKVTRGTTGIENLESLNKSDEQNVRSTFYTLDGKQVENVKAKSGTYIVKSGNKTRKINR